MELLAEGLSTSIRDRLTLARRRKEVTNVVVGRRVGYLIVCLSKCYTHVDEF